MSIKDVQSRIWEIEEKKRQEADAERQRRRAADTARQTEQAEAAEYAALLKERQRLELEAAEQTNKGLISENHAHLHALLTVATAALEVLPDVRAAYQGMLGSYEEQRDFTDGTIRKYQQYVAGPQDANNPIEFQQFNNSRAQAILNAQQRLENAIHPQDALIEWIAQGSDETDRQARAGLVAMLTGKVYSPNRDYSARGASNARVNAERNRR